jgi:hypothetical protein
VNAEKRFAENPIVSRLEDGSYLAVYDNDARNAYEADTVRWRCGPQYGCNSRLKLSVLGSNLTKVLGAVRCQIGGCIWHAVE